MERFLIEGVRVNMKHDSLGGFTQAETIAIGLVVIGLVMAVWRWSRSR